MVLFTLDGLLLSPIFDEDYYREVELVLAEQGISDQWDQHSYDAFYEKLDGMISYRKAYVSLMDVPINVVGYTTDIEDFTMGSNKNINELRCYLLETFLDRMTEDDEDIAKLMLERLADQMCEAVSDHNKQLERNLDRGIDLFKKRAKEFGIKVTKDEVLQATMLLSLASADQRNWLTRGFSDNELIELDDAIDSDIFKERFEIGGAEAEEVEEIDPSSGEKIYRIRR